MTRRHFPNGLTIEMLPEKKPLKKNDKCHERTREATQKPSKSMIVDSQEETHELVIKKKP